MTLNISAIDAFVGGLATAFFAGLLASGAYLLKQLLALKEQVATVAARPNELQGIEEAWAWRGGVVGLHALMETVGQSDAVTA